VDLSSHTGIPQQNKPRFWHIFCRRRARMAPGKNGICSLRNSEMPLLGPLSHSL
jgi:hypothetical protein